MAEVTSRNFPISPKTGSAEFPEISRAPYKGGGEKREEFREGRGRPFRTEVAARLRDR